MTANLEKKNLPKQYLVFSKPCSGVFIKIAGLISIISMLKMTFVKCGTRGGVDILLECQLPTLACRV